MAKDRFEYHEKTPDPLDIITGVREGVVRDNATRNEGHGSRRTNESPDVGEGPSVRRP